MLYVTLTVDPFFFARKINANLLTQTQILSQLYLVLCSLAIAAHCTLGECHVFVATFTFFWLLLLRKSMFVVYVYCDRLCILFAYLEIKYLNNFTLPFAIFTTISS